MTVAELITELGRMPQDYQISVCDSRDEYCDLDKEDIQLFCGEVVIDVSYKNM